jgi:hypothetical protein
MHMSSVSSVSTGVGLKQPAIRISPDLLAVALFSLLGLAITGVVFPILAAYDLQSLLALPG